MSIILAPGIMMAGAAAGAGTVGGLGYLFWKHLRWPLVGLFSRLVRDRALDQPRRRNIMDLVQDDPGIHLSGIAKTLHLGQGHALYHLGVLQREGFVFSVATPGLRCYFSSAKIDASKARRLALLRQEPLRRLHELVRASPGRPVAACAQALGVSGPRTSKLARTLESEGLLERRRQGRETLLFPAGDADARPTMRPWQSSSATAANPTSV